MILEMSALLSLAAAWHFRRKLSEPGTAATGSQLALAHTSRPTATAPGSDKSAAETFMEAFSEIAPLRLLVVFRGALELSSTPAYLLRLSPLAAKRDQAGNGHPRSRH